MKIFFSAIIIILIAGYLFAEQSFQHGARKKRDPFVPLVSGDGVYASDAYGIRGIKDIRLEGIVWDEAEGSIAIINGEIVREGQEIGSVRVLKIEYDGAIFELDGERVRIELREDE